MKVLLESSPFTLVYPAWNLWRKLEQAERQSEWGRNEVWSKCEKVTEVWKVTEACNQDVTLLPTDSFLSQLLHLMMFYVSVTLSYYKLLLVTFRVTVAKLLNHTVTAMRRLSNWSQFWLLNFSSFSSFNALTTSLSLSMKVTQFLMFLRWEGSTRTSKYRGRCYKTSQISTDLTTKDKPNRLIFSIQKKVKLK